MFQASRFLEMVRKDERQRMSPHKWEPITDVPTNYDELESKELRSLSQVWREQSEKLRESDALRKFNDELGRRWAIETGIIENLYSIDRGTTELLIQQGIQSSLIQHGSTNKPVTQVIGLIKDHETVLETVFDFVKQRRILSTSYIKALHFQLTHHQQMVEGVDSLGQPTEFPLKRGEWKSLPNNPTRPEGDIHQYCPPEHVASEMDNLIEMHQVHEEFTVSPEVEAAWFHHRFTQIHPFQDGNGRVARALASLIFLREGWFPLVIDRDNRSEYIDALEKADAGDLTSLIDLFSRIEKKAFVKALSISDDLLSREEARRQILSSAREKLETRTQKKQAKLEGVFEISSALEQMALNEMSKVAQEIDQLVKLESSESFARAEKSTDGNNFWFHGQIVYIARKLDYYADTGTYKSWVRLKIKEQRQHEIIVSFHSLGTDFVGVVGVSAFVQARDPSEDSGSTILRPNILSSEVFQFSYGENQREVEIRFEKWLNDVIDAGLDEWRRQL